MSLTTQLLRMNDCKFHIHHIFIYKSMKFIKISEPFAWRSVDMHQVNPSCAISMYSRFLFTNWTSNSTLMLSFGSDCNVSIVTVYHRDPF